MSAGNWLPGDGRYLRFTVERCIGTCDVVLRDVVRMGGRRCRSIVGVLSRGALVDDVHGVSVTMR